jgi:hypothetical protein
MFVKTAPLGGDHQLDRMYSLIPYPNICLNMRRKAVLGD